MELESLTQLSALAHPQRLAVFRLLMRRHPDAMPAGDIAQTLDVPRSTLSPYLSSLTAAGLLRQTRVGTSLLYQADPVGAGALVDYLVADCCRGRPALCAPQGGALSAVPHRVLFVCSGNSARSIMAETLLHDLAGDRFDVYSAGTRPRSQLNPYAVDLLIRQGHTTHHLRAKTLAEFQTDDAPQMDFVFTVCDSAANVDCPPLQGQPLTSHWGLPDPAAATGRQDEIQRAFQDTYDRLRRRIETFAALPIPRLDRPALQSCIDDIASLKDTHA